MQRPCNQEPHLSLGALTRSPASGPGPRMPMYSFHKLHLDVLRVAVIHNVAWLATIKHLLVCERARLIAYFFENPSFSMKSTGEMVERLHLDVKKEQFPNK